MKLLEDRACSSALPSILTLHQTFPGLTHVLTERLQMWEGPLIYFPLWFILPLHITLVWQQCIIRLHMIYKIIAAVWKYSEQENFRSTLSHRFADMHAHGQILWISWNRTGREGNEKLFFLLIRYFQHSLPACFVHKYRIKSSSFKNIQRRSSGGKQHLGVKWWRNRKMRVCIT